MATFTRIVSDLSQVRYLEKVYNYRTIVIAPYGKGQWWCVQERPADITDAKIAEAETE